MATTTENSIGVIETFTGKHFDLCDPRPEMVCIEDIAHALARICRYTGHPRYFYSVAQHCIACAALAEQTRRPIQDIRYVLMHDAAEAYIGDINAPLKRLLRPIIKPIEQRVMYAVELALDLSHCNYTAEDVSALITEADMLMPSRAFWWDCYDPDLIDARLRPWQTTVEDAEAVFLAAYHRLTAALDPQPK